MPGDSPRAAQSGKTWDDGEPGGTAGLPILARIDGTNLLNVVIVVTRYFGGTKLGKGGLIRAYGTTAHQAIHAAKIVECVQTSLFAPPLGLFRSGYRTRGSFLHELVYQTGAVWCPSSDRGRDTKR